jgi:hypothetical membrane protein
MRLLALGGPAAPLLFATLVTVCGALRPGYSHVTQFISELGEVGSSHSCLMNYGAFIPTGLLLIAFSASLWRSFPRTASSIAGTLLVGAFGAGIAGAGIWSCDPGCPQVEMSREAAMHEWVSYLAFAGGVAAPAAWVFAFRRSSSWRSLWVYSLLTAAVAAILLAALAAAAASRVSVGMWQRLFLGVPYLWCAIVGVRAFRLDRGHERRTA